MNFKFLCVSAAVAFTITDVVHAQTPTWAFSKDTVYEWEAHGDSVLIANSGTDSLWFDSIALELVHPVDSQYQVLFQFQAPNTSGAGVILGYSPSGTRYISPADGPKGWGVASGESARLWSFNGNYSVLTVNMKRSAIVPGDTVLMRIILTASFARGRDTLMFLSKQDGPTALRSPVMRENFKDLNSTLYDLRGRRVGHSPGARLPATLVLTPKD